MSLEIRKFQRPDGHLWPFMLYKGMPLILPNLWVNEHVAASRPNTADAYLRDLLLIYAAAHLHEFSIEARFRSLQGFSRKELRLLARALSKTRAGGSASKASCDRRVESIKSFIRFGFEYFKQVKQLTLLEQAQAEKNTEQQCRILRKRILEEANKGKGPNCATALSEKEIAIIESVLHPLSALNPYKDPRVRVRNYCIFRILSFTGIRRSEVVLLELDDVNLSCSPTITIKAPTISNKAKRRDGANLKTFGRELPISLDLAKDIEEYLEIWRRELIWPKRPSPALFLSAKDGRRLCANTINLIFDSLYSVTEIANIGKRIHPHGIRTTGLTEIRRKIQKNGSGTESSLHEELAYAGGWVQGSQMVSHYTRAAISENLALKIRGKSKGEANDISKFRK